MRENIVLGTYAVCTNKLMNPFNFRRSTIIEIHYFSIVRTFLKPNAR